MPRSARRQSGTDIYHVMLRGINKQRIFYDEEDYVYFIELLNRFKPLSRYEIYAYCLMSNHIHLLIKTAEEPLEIVFRRIGAAFVYWYNLKYQRTGHLFQDRFKSEPVEDDRYFLAVLRYILRNPVKAGICARPEEYPYSNMKDYFSPSQLSLPCPLDGDELLAFIEQDEDDDCLDVSEQPRCGVTDAAAKELIRKELGAAAPRSNREYRESQKAAIRRLLKQGLTIRQLCKLTDISKYHIEQALK